MYTVDYGTGSGNLTGIKTLEEAQALADRNCSYTQEDICIYADTAADPVMIRRWWAVKFDPSRYEDGEEADVIPFGDFGYYDEWEEL